jgi:hypothetical protein
MPQFTAVAIDRVPGQILLCIFLFGDVDQPSVFEQAVSWRDVCERYLGVRSLELISIRARSISGSAVAG